MIIFTHHTGEAHGILGPQVAASFFQRELSLAAMVVGVEREFSRENLVGFIDDYYAKREKVAAFSHLCGRPDLLELVEVLKQKGFVTILGGPQVRQDYQGEPETESYPHRFKGLRSIIDIALQGPVDGLGHEDLRKRGVLIEHPWTKNIFLEVDWSNLYTFSDALKKREVRSGQVVNAIGCPYAGKPQIISLPPPIALQDRGIPEIEVRSNGCIFCDVSRDKGYHGSIESDLLLGQIERLPEIDGMKIPFEMIDEYPIRPLLNLLEKAERHRIRLSQVNLVCRVDEINAHVSEIETILSLARQQGTRIMFSSIGFESFSDRLLQYFCKGITLREIITCVETLRRLKERFRSTLLYRRDEGACHGFIRPTPWDDSETLQEVDTNIFLYRLFEDILPEHSTPLIIHHASYLGDWIRQIESITGITFRRQGTWIEWWNPCL